MAWVSGTHRIKVDWQTDRKIAGQNYRKKRHKAQETRPSPQDSGHKTENIGHKDTLTQGHINTSKKK